ncbi:MGMT family protein [Patescibacteria group bacterium]|nr:MGMT family protein [Patescibacteria group bacterium]
MKTFTEKVIDIVKKIPRGKTMTYVEVARKAGSSNASRAVGSIMAKNQDKTVPCHRVIRSDGTIGLYNRLQGSSKEALLRKEGAIT